MPRQQPRQAAERSGVVRTATSLPSGQAPTKAGDRVAKRLVDHPAPRQAAPVAPVGAHGIGPANYQPKGRVRRFVSRQLMRPATFVAAIAVAVGAGGTWGAVLSEQSPAPSAPVAGIVRAAGDGSTETIAPASPAASASDTEYVTTDGETIDDVAAATGRSVETLLWANGIAEPDEPLPAGTSLSVPPVDGIEHVVEAGDTLDGIAAEYGVTAADIQSYGPNGVQSDADLVPGETITVPGGSIQDRSAVATYTVEPGDTIRSIASRFGLDSTTVLGANDLPNPDLIQPGQELTILPTNGVLVTVAEGDTIGDIAARYGVESTAIMDYQANAVTNGDLIFPGQELVIPGAAPDPWWETPPVQEADTSGDAAESDLPAETEPPVIPEAPPPPTPAPATVQAPPIATGKDPAEGEPEAPDNQDGPTPEPEDDVAQLASVGEGTVAEMPTPEPPPAVQEPPAEPEPVTTAVETPVDAAPEQAAPEDVVPEQSVVEPTPAPEPPAPEPEPVVVTPEPTPEPAPPPPPPPAPEPEPPAPPPAPQRSAPSGSFIWPAQGVITQYFSGGHNGWDIANAAYTPIHAADAGRVTFAGWNNYGLGYAVAIDHGNGFVTWYGHMAEPPAVGVGQWVAQGEYIGPMGSTGNSTGPHVHFMIQLNGVYQNPGNYLS